MSITKSYNLPHTLRSHISVAHVSKCIQYEQQDTGKSTFRWFPRGAFYPGSHAGHVTSTTAFSWGSYYFLQLFGFLCLKTSTLWSISQVFCHMTWSLSDIFLMVRLRLHVSGRWRVTHPTFAMNKCVALFYNKSHGMCACLHLIWSTSNIFPFY